MEPPDLYGPSLPPVRNGEILDCSSGQIGEIFDGKTREHMATIVSRKWEHWTARDDTVWEDCQTLDDSSFDIPPLYHLQYVTPSPDTTDLTPSPVMRDLTPSPVMRDLIPSPVMRGLTPSLVMRGLTPSPVIRDLTPSPVMRDLTPSSVMRGLTPSPVMRDLTPSQDDIPVESKPQSCYSSGDGSEHSCSEDEHSDSGDVDTCSEDEDKCSGHGDSSFENEDSSSENEDSSSENEDSSSENEDSSSENEENCSEDTENCSDDKEHCSENEDDAEFDPQHIIASARQLKKCGDRCQRLYTRLDSLKRLKRQVGQNLRARLRVLGQKDHPREELIGQLEELDWHSSELSFIEPEIRTLRLSYQIAMADERVVERVYREERGKAKQAGLSEALIRQLTNMPSPCLLPRPIPGYVWRERPVPRTWPKELKPSRIPLPIMRYLVPTSRQVMLKSHIPAPVQRLMDQLGRRYEGTPGERRTIVLFEPRGRQIQSPRLGTVGPRERNDTRSGYGKSKIPAPSKYGPRYIPHPPKKGPVRSSGYGKSKPRGSIYPAVRPEPQSTTQSIAGSRGRGKSKTPALVSKGNSFSPRRSVVRSSGYGRSKPRGSISPAVRKNTQPPRQASLGPSERKDPHSVWGKSKIPAPVRLTERDSYEPFRARDSSSGPKERKDPQSDNRKSKIPAPIASSQRNSSEPPRTRDSSLGPRERKDPRSDDRKSQIPAPIKTPPRYSSKPRARDSFLRPRERKDPRSDHRKSQIPVPIKTAPRHSSEPPRTRDMSLGPSERKDPRSDNRKSNIHAPIRSLSRDSFDPPRATYSFLGPRKRRDPRSDDRQSKIPAPVETAPRDNSEPPRTRDSSLGSRERKDPRSDHKKSKIPAPICRSHVTSHAKSANNGRSMPPLPGDPKPDRNVCGFQLYPRLPPITAGQQRGSGNAPSSRNEDGLQAFPKLPPIAKGCHQGSVMSGVQPHPPLDPPSHSRRPVLVNLPGGQTQLPVLTQQGPAAYGQRCPTPPRTPRPPSTSGNTWRRVRVRPAVISCIPYTIKPAKGILKLTEADFEERDALYSPGGTLLDPEPTFPNMDTFFHGLMKPRRIIPVGLFSWTDLNHRKVKFGYEEKTRGSHWARDGPY